MEENNVPKSNAPGAQGDGAADVEVGARQDPKSLKREQNTLVPAVSAAHTYRSSLDHGDGRLRSGSRAAALNRRMESNIFLGRIHPSRQPGRVSGGEIQLHSPLSAEAYGLAPTIRIGPDGEFHPLAGVAEGGGAVAENAEEYQNPQGVCERIIFNMQKCLCEFFATMIIVSAVAFGLAKAEGEKAAPFSITSTIFALITLFKDISGAHFNPAVSCTIFMTDPRFTLVDLLSYVCAQLLGGIVGAFIGYGIMGKALDILPLDPGMSASRQLFHEVIPTMVMIYAVLALVFGSGVTWELTIPFVVSACILAGAFAGATMNPAVTFGIFVSNICTKNTNIDVDALMVTLFGPFLGGMFAFVGYIATHAYHNPVPLRFLNFKGT